MKKLLIIFAICLVICGQAFAAPFVVCDPDSTATSYIVILDSGEEIETPIPLHFDLSGIDEGSHIVEVRAKNIWGVSSAVPLEFTKALPQSPTNMRLDK